MIKKTKNNLYIYIWVNKLLCNFSFTYHPKVKRGKKPKYNEMLKIVHPIVIKEKISSINSNDRYLEYNFAIEKALRFIEEISKIDETKRDYYNIYYNHYFKAHELDKLNIYDVADTFYCSVDKIKCVITDCNNLVHKFILYYKNQDVNNIDECIIDKPYYTFVDDNINIDEIIDKLKL